jgi:secondary thiamine-phosphate synthase enzyme
VRQETTQLTLETRPHSLTEITEPVVDWVAECGVDTGLLTVYIQHTSASLTIQENADPDVQRDLVRFFERLVPEDDRLYIHSAEGPDDMPAHIKSALTQVNLSIPVINGRLALGTWQGVYIFEHRARPHRRRITLHLLGES